MISKKLNYFEVSQLGMTPNVTNIIFFVSSIFSQGEGKMYFFLHVVYKFT